MQPSLLRRLTAVCAAFVVLALALPGLATDPAQTSASIGRLLLTNLASAPFPHPQRAKGHRYQDKLYPAAPHYSGNTVAIFFPPGFRPTEKVDFIVHFHGWHNEVTNVLAQFRLPEQLAASRRNAVLVVPQGPRNAPDSFGGKLEDAGGFQRFMREVLAAMHSQPGFRDAAIGNIILSGHSGGYHAIAAVLDRGGRDAPIGEVWLFDALYGQADSYRAWARQAPHRLMAIYTDHGGTLAETRQFMASLKEAKVDFLAVEDSLVKQAELKVHRLIFLHTGLGHNDVLAKRDTFRSFLEASPLLQ